MITTFAGLNTYPFSLKKAFNQIGYNQDAYQTFDHQFKTVEFSLKFEVKFALLFMRQPGRTT